MSGALRPILDCLVWVDTLGELLLVIFGTIHHQSSLNPSPLKGFS